MRELVIDEVNVTVEGFEPSTAEIREYIKLAREDSNGDTIAEVKLVKNQNGCIDMDFRPKDKPFERIARITGYLGTTDRFNDAKRAEVADRVKHDVE